MADTQTASTATASGQQSSSVPPTHEGQTGTTDERSSDITRETLADMPDEDFRKLLAEKRGGGSQQQQKPGTGKAPKDPTEGKPADTQPPTTQAPENQNEPAVLQKMVRDQNQFIGRMSNELGTLRKQNETMAKQLQELHQKLSKPAPGSDPEADAVTVENFLKDPQAEVGKLVDEELKKREQAKTDQTEAELAASRECYEAVSAVLPEGVKDVDVMPYVFAGLLSDGVPEDEIRKFAANPFKFKKSAVVSLIRRGLAELKADRLANPPKKEPTSGSQPPTKRKQPHVTSMTASQGQATPTGQGSPTVTRERLAAMSEDELQEYKRQLKNKRGE